MQGSHEDRSDGATTSEPIVCVFATDDNYCQHLGVTIASLLANTKEDSFDFHIVHYGVSQNNREKIQQLVTPHPKIRLTWYEFDASQYSHFRLDGHITIASYFRLFLTDILPQSISKLLYLDCDLVILGDIKSLWDIDLSGRPIAAGADAWMVDDQRLPTTATHQYFNAGVLIIDLDKWRVGEYRNKFIEVIEVHHDIIRYHDQDVLNIIFSDLVHPLPLSWNHHARNSEVHYSDLGIDQAAAREIIENPQIIHYTTNAKPWFYAFDVKYEDQYYKYLAMTPWRDFVPPDRNLKTVVRRHSKRYVKWVLKRYAPKLFEALKGVRRSLTESKPVGAS